MVFNFSKKDFATRLTLSENLKNGIWLRRFAKGFLFLSHFKKFFWVSFYNKFAGFFSKCPSFKEVSLET